MPRSASSELDSFVRKQPTLDREMEAVVTAGEPAEAARRHDPMTWDHQRKIIRAARLSDRARAGVQLAGDFTVAADPSRGNGGILSQTRRWNCVPTGLSGSSRG